MQRMKHILKSKYFWVLAVILTGAAIIRLYKISEYMNFLGDEGRDALAVYNILHGHPTLLGPAASVGGFYYGPFYFYFIAPFYLLFNYDPVGASVLVALIGVLTIWLLYKVGSEFFSKPAALIAAFLYTIAPIVIVYSRSSWNPNVTPLFSLLTMYTLYQALKKNNWLLFLLCGLLFGLDIQLHYTELFIGLAIFLSVIFWRFFRQKKSLVSKLIHVIKDDVYLFIGFLIGFSPFLAFEARHQFLNIRNIITFVFGSQQKGDVIQMSPLASIWDALFRLFARIASNFPASGDFHYYVPTMITIWYWSIIGIIGLSFIAFFLTYKNAYRKNEQQFRQLTIFLLWVVCSLLFFAIYKKSTYDYYLENIFTVPFLLVSNAIYFIWQKKIIGKVFALFCFVFLVGVNLYGFPLRYPPIGYLTRTKDVSRAVFEKSGGKPFNFALITASNSDHAYRYFFTLWGNAPVTIENSQNDPERRTVTKQLLVVCEEVPCMPLNDPLWEIAGFGQAKIAGKWFVGGREIYKLIPPQSK